MLGHGQDDGVCIPFQSSGETFGCCIEAGDLEDGARCFDDRSEGSCRAGSLCYSRDSRARGLCDSHEDCDEDSYCYAAARTCVAKGTCTDTCNAGTGTKTGYAACSSPEMSCVPRQSPPNLGICE